MQISFDEVALRPIVQAVVSELESQRRRLPDGRLGFTEAEAAAALGIAPHVLRDARLRGEIKARRIGRRYVYSRDALLAFLAAY